MKQLKNLFKQKNALLCLATCIALSSITINCDSCEPEEGKSETLKFTLTSSKNIKGTEEGEFKVKKTEGNGKFADAKVKFTGHASFVKADGTALAETVKLNELLGKDENEEMDDDEMTIKVKAVTPAPAANVTLKMSIGNDDNATAYMSETDAVTWEVAAPTATVTFGTNKSIINTIDPTSVITIAPGGTNVKYQDVFVKITGGLVAFEAKVHGGAVAVQLNTIVSLNTKIALHDLLNALNPGVPPIVGTVDIPTAGHKIEVTKHAGAPVGEHALNVVAGTTAVPNCYANVVDFIKWQEQRIELHPAAHVVATSSNEATITFKMTGSELPTNAVSLVFGGADVADFVYTDTVGAVGAVGGGVLLNTFPNLGTSVAKDGTFSIKVKVNTAVINAIDAYNVHTALTQAVVNLKGATAAAAAGAAKGVADVLIDANTVVDALITAAAGEAVVHAALVALKGTFNTGAPAAAVSPADLSADKVAEVARINGLINGHVIPAGAAVGPKVLNVSMVNSTTPAIIYMADTQIVAWTAS